MKAKSLNWASLVLTLSFCVSACGPGQMLGQTITPSPTTTPTPTLTPTSTPTLTPTLTSTATKVPPTRTKVPPTSTAAPMGEPVSSTDYEVNVIGMRTLDTVYLDSFYHWVPTDGNMFVELGIKVVNLKTGSKISVPWGNIYVRQMDGNSWSPNWGEFKPVASGIEINPKSLVFRSLDNPAEQVVFDEVVFIRAIYGVAKHNPSPTTILFGFGDAPLIKIVVP